MDFSDHLAALAVRIPRQLDHLKTEAAVSAALVLPFIQALGYNIFDPTEVVPEFDADVANRKGEKVDYAVLRDGQPSLLIEVKHHSVDLGAEHASQLFRYFTVTPARFGILTNGVIYKFFTDLEEPNKMDERPFLEFSMLELKDPIIDALKRFTKGRFQVDSAVSAATDLKYTNGVKKALASEYADPSEEFVRYFAKQVYGGNLTPARREAFRDIVRRAFQHFVNETINERLQTAIASSEPRRAPETEAPADVAADGGDIVTTPEEVEGFHIIRAILAEIVDPERVVMRDAKSYCAILFDDNNRRPICRLYFGSKSLRVGLIDRAKAEQRVALDRLADIYKHAERLRDVVRGYLETAAG